MKYINKHTTFKEMCIELLHEKGDAEYIDIEVYSLSKGEAVKSIKLSDEMDIPSNLEDITIIDYDFKGIFSHNIIYI